MNNFNQSDILITGVGVSSAVGQGKAEFMAALLAGRHAFGTLQRQGRQYTTEEGVQTSFLGAEITELNDVGSCGKQSSRKASLSARIAAVTLQEAWQDAGLDAADPSRIGLIVGGSNIQQRELFQIQKHYRDKPHFLRPTYGLTFMDSDISGVCTEQFGIKGLAYTIGGASASGQLAIIQAIQSVLSGQTDICIAMGAMMDLSFWECQGLRTMGAMGTDRFAGQPDMACRPFDSDSDGFIFGENCGALVIEKATAATRVGLNPYATVSGWGITMDANRQANPSREGEVEAIGKALAHAETSPEEIDYINPHGTGSTIGDQTELQALRECKLSHAHINTTKSLIGHGLSAAGAVEVIATLLQMQAGRLHACRNLERPIEDDWNWVIGEPGKHRIENALTLSMGFSGINTALCLRRFD